MPHVSQRTLKKQTIEKINKTLITAILSLNTKANGKLFLKELLTPTEQLMLGKRISIIYMLTKGYSFREIEQTLKVTPQTITRIWKMYKNNELKNIVVIFKKQNKGLLDELEKIIGAGLPPIAGRGRWKNIYR